MKGASARLASRVDVAPPNGPLPHRRGPQQRRVVLQEVEPANPRRARHPRPSDRIVSPSDRGRYHRGHQVAPSPSRCGRHHWCGRSLQAILVRRPTRGQRTPMRGGGPRSPASTPLVPWWPVASCSSGLRRASAAPLPWAAHLGTHPQYPLPRFLPPRRGRTTVPRPAGEEPARARLENPWSADRSRAFEGRSCLCLQDVVATHNPL